MSLWLQQEMQKVQDRRKQVTPTSGHTKIAIIVFVLIEAALLIVNQLTPDYNALPLCGMVGFMGILIIVLFSTKASTVSDKPVLPFAMKCMEQLRFSPEELQQFDSEMTAAPLALINSANRSDISLIITKHYLADAFLNMGEIDYGIYRISDIFMTCYASGRNNATVNPFDKVYDIDLINAAGDKIGGLTIEGKKNFMELNSTLEKIAPHIQLNVSMKEVKKLRKNSGN